MIDVHALILAYSECIVGAGFVGGLVFLLGLARTRSSR